MEKTIVWRDVAETPPKDGFYFCWHGTWGRVVLGYRGGWGNYPPEKWMEHDGLPDEYPGKL